MTFKPPYWYHDNIEFNQEQLNQLKLELELIGFQKYAKNKEHISTYFIKQHQRPEKKYVEVYEKIVEDITKSVGIFHKVTYPKNFKYFYHTEKIILIVYQSSWIVFISNPF